MNGYKLTLVAFLISFSSSCSKNIPTSETSENVKTANYQEGPNTTGVLKEGPNTTGVLKEGPNTTGVLKEGPNTTGVLKEGPNTTGSLRLTEKFILLTRQGIDYDIPVTPETIKSIDVVYLQNKVSLKPEEISLIKDTLSTKYVSESDIETVQAAYDGFGGFKFKFKSQDTDAIFKFEMLDGTKLSVPLIKDEDSIKVVINKISNDVKAKSYNKENAYIINNSINNQEFITLIDENNNKQLYLTQDLENKVTSGLKGYSISEREGSKEEKLKIFSEIKEISPISAFVGAWKYKLLNYKLSLDILDTGEGTFKWILRKNNNLYQGIGTYSKNNKNDSILIEGKFVDTTIRIKVESKEANVITVTDILENSEESSISGGISLNLYRSIR